ncbi:MAG: hypothetical protein RLY93_04420 [Sumerlaeia bacterium]
MSRFSAFLFLPILVACVLASSAFAQPQIGGWDVLRGDDVYLTDDGRHVIQALPPQANLAANGQLRVHFTEPVARSNQHALRLRLKYADDIDVGAVAHLRSGLEELWLSREAVDSANGGQQILWTFDPRLGAPDSVTSLTLAFRSRAGRQKVQLLDIELVPAPQLSAADWLQASVFEPVSLAFHALPRSSTGQQAIISLPGPFVFHFEGGELRLRLNDRDLPPIPLQIVSASDAETFFRRVNIPTYGQPGDVRTLRVTAHGPAGNEFLVSEKSFRILPEERSFGQFEAPFQSIVDYTVHDAGADSVITAILQDPYAAQEPPTALTATHQVDAFTFSFRSGMFEAETIWQVPAYGHWASAGFRSLAHGANGDANGLYASANNLTGRAVMGLASAAGNTRPIPAELINPAFVPVPLAPPPDEHEEREILAHTIAPYGRGHVMLTWMTVNRQPPVLVASVSPTLRFWMDAGQLDIPSLPAGTSHLSLHRRGPQWLLLTDDPTRVWVSSDPLRHWVPIAADFPRDWHAFSLHDIDGKPHLFGLTGEYGRDVLRWLPVDWRPNPDGLALPVLVENSQAAGETIPY